MLRLLLFLILTAPCLAQPASTPHVVATLIADREAILPGEPFHVALRLEMEKGWHTYWKNPGDAGMPIAIEWDLPDGFTAGPILWPYPHQFGAAPEVSYGYEDEVLLPVEIIPPATRRAGDSITIRAHATWLVCRELCMKGKADLALTLPVTDAPDDRPARWSDLFKETYKHIPRSSSGLTVNVSRSGNAYELRIIGAESNALTLPQSVIFFSADESVIDHSAEQKFTVEGNVLRMILAASPYENGPAKRLRGVIVVNPESADSTRAIEIDVAVEGSAD